MMLNKTNTIETIPSDRFKISEDIYSGYMSCIDNPYHFDYQYFGLSKVEATTIDPQALQILEQQYFLY